MGTTYEEVGFGFLSSEVASLPVAPSDKDSKNCLALKILNFSEMMAAIVFPYCIISGNSELFIFILIRPNFSSSHLHYEFYLLTYCALALQQYHYQLQTVYFPLVGHKHHVVLARCHSRFGQADPVYKLTEVYDAVVMSHGVDISYS